MNKIIYSPRINNDTPSMIAVGDVIGMLKELIVGKRVVFITDSNLFAAYSDIIAQHSYIIIGQGEENKNITAVEQIHRQLLQMQADRSTYIVGFGGGIVTDITGFAASTYMRGIGFGFVATSLLAQVDASVGGKNGVNLDGYKNIVGTFNQPDFVLCDQSLLKTLPERELRAGMSEALKCGIIGDSMLFEIFRDNDFNQIIANEELLFDVVVRSVELKASVVAQDERESGLRKLLNLGHTFAHAIEKCSRHYIHGEAVAIGLAIIARLSVQLGMLSGDDKDAVITAISRLSLPLQAPELDFAELLEAARSDKKRAGQNIELILIDKIGECRIAKFTIAELMALK